MMVDVGSIVTRATTEYYMYIITFKGKPQTIGQVYARTGGMHDISEANNVLACKTRKDTIEMFIHYVGFTWAEWRTDGYSVRKLVLA
jgi:hypothetical protein